MIRPERQNAGMLYRCTHVATVGVKGKYTGLTMNYKLAFDAE